MGGTRDFEGCITHGPWGGSEGRQWVYMPQGLTLTKKIQITVRFDDVVYSIEFESLSSEGEGQRSRFGSQLLGCNSRKISIDNTNEYLMSISGTFGSNCYDPKVVVLKSLCFTTNLNLYGPYGRQDADDHVFSHDIKNGVVVGFHGRANANGRVTAIGIYVMPKSLASSCNFTNESELMTESGVVMSRDIGPWGASGGKSWDDGVFSTIKQVRVHVGALNVIYALQFMYQKADGRFVLSHTHGGKDGLKVQMVNLDEKGEFLTGISGFYGPVVGYNGLEAITSISFYTNKRIYGPFGEERGAGYVYFSSTSSLGKVVGFHGRTNGFLSAIGVLMEYF